MVAGLSRALFRCIGRVVLAWFAAAPLVAQVLVPPLSAPLPARAGNTHVTPEWLLAHYRIVMADFPYTIAWSADGQRLFYHLNDSVFAVTVRGGRIASLGAGNHPIPSPDGSSLAFLRTVRDTTQLWVMRTDGTAARAVTDVAGGLIGWPGYDLSYAWSPDSRQLSLSFVLNNADTPLARYAAPQVWDSAHSSATELGAAKTHPLHGQLWLLDRESSARRLLLSVPYGISDLSWFPGGREILFTANRAWFQSEDRQNLGHVRAVRVSDGAVRTIAAPTGLQQELHPALSADGRWAAFAYDPDSPVYPFIGSIGIAAAVGSTRDGANVASIRRLTEDAKFHGVHWGKDERMLFALRSYGAFRQIYRVEVPSGKLTPLTKGPVGIAGFALSPDGKTLTWFGSDAHGTRRIGLCGLDGAGARDVVQIPTAAPDLQLSEVREIGWRSRDGLEMRGLLVLPVDYDSTRRYPLVVDLHGGGWASELSPNGSVTNSPLEWQIWAGKGYVVLAPDYRTTAAYGWRRVLDMVARQDPSDRDMDDELSGVDALIAAGVADSTRMAVYGHSAGGVHTNWFVARTRNRFRAAVSYEGPAESYLASATGENAGGNPNMRWIHRGWPWEVPENYLRNSAITYIRGATTPTLFLMGDRLRGSADISNSVEFLYTALKQQGVETKYVRYPDEGHTIVRQPNLRDALMRTLNWIDSHIGDPGSP